MVAARGDEITAGLGTGHDFEHFPGHVAFCALCQAMCFLRLAS
jgi:hypothetical protein